jgi:hypothetical protein
MVETRSMLVPLYVHPLVDPAAWEALARSAPRLYGVVLNAADGPGSTYDPAFADAAGLLRAAGVRVLGYVDTAYGDRPVGDIVADARRHRQWYGTDGLFLDQAASEGQLVPHYRRLAAEARRLGAHTVVLNPGVHPDPGYARIADLLVTYEGGWDTYHRAGTPGWTADHPPERFCHLIHGVPAGLSGLAARTARLRGAAVHCAVTGDGANPWDALPEALHAG